MFFISEVRPGPNGTKVKEAARLASQAPSQLLEVLEPLGLSPPSIFRVTNSPQLLLMKNP